MPLSVERLCSRVPPHLNLIQDHFNPLELGMPGIFLLRVRAIKSPLCGTGNYEKEHSWFPAGSLVSSSDLVWKTGLNEKARAAEKARNCYDRGLRW